MNDNELIAACKIHVNEIDRILECPVCYTRPVEILMCANGHNVCGICQPRLDRCPSCCVNDIPSIRNLSLEKTCREIEQIDSLIRHHDYKMYTTRTTQTQEEELEEQFLSCGIGCCSDQVLRNLLHKHVFAKHRNHVTDLFLEEGLAEVIWECYSKFEYGLNKIFDYAAYHEDLGMFFISVHIGPEGNTTIDFHMTSSFENSHYLYEIRLHIPDAKDLVEFTGEVEPCKISYKKFENSHKCDKRLFRRYLADDGTVQFLKCKEKPIALQIYIRPKLLGNS